MRKFRGSYVRYHDSHALGKFVTEEGVPRSKTRIRMDDGDRDKIQVFAIMGSYRECCGCRSNPPQKKGIVTLKFSNYPYPLPTVLASLILPLICSP